MYDFGAINYLIEVYFKMCVVVEKVRYFNFFFFEVTNEHYDDIQHSTKKNMITTMFT